jgi:hypothetical protein
MPVRCSSYRHGFIVSLPFHCTIGLSWQLEDKTEVLRAGRPEPDGGYSACSVGQTSLLE